MSNAFRQKFGNKKYTRKDAKAFVAQTFPVDEEGRPLYVTEQGHKKECDVNLIIQKYDRTGLINHVNTFVAIYGDVSSIDFRNALELNMKVGEHFNELPSNIRKRFENDPLQFISFLENPKNYAESVELGLRRNDQPPPKTLQNAPGSEKNSAEGHDSGKTK